MRYAIVSPMRESSRSGPVQLPLEAVGPGTCFIVTLLYLVVLGTLAWLYRWDKLNLDDSGLEYVAVIAWFAGLGGAMASLHLIYRDLAKWHPAANLAYLIRPVTGAIFGSVAYFIYIVLAQASVNVLETDLPNRLSILAMMIAFALGYREEIFRRLLQRVIDLIATAGGADTEPPSAPRDVTCRRTGTGGVQLSWLAASDNVAVVGYNVYRDYRFLAAIRTADETPQEPAAGSATGSGERGAPLRSFGRIGRSGRNPAPAPPAGGRPPEPARRLQFRDDNPRRPKHLYSLTAVDGAGNESEAVGPFVVDLAPPDPA